MSDRARLPSRRQSITEVLYWPLPASAGGSLETLGRKVFLTAGFDPSSGRILEVFLRGGSKHGDRIDFALDEVAIAISRHLQAGIGLLDFFRVDGPIFAITDLLAPLEARASDRRAAALMIEAVLHRLVQLECAHGAEIRSIGAR